MKRVIVGAVGAVLLLLGVALLVLPGPGLLLVLAGLLILASEFPGLERHVEPVRRQAMRAADESVSSPWRIAGTIVFGLFMITAGVVWGVVDSLPLSGWSTGTSLMLSGLVILGLLVWSYRRARSRVKT